MSEEEKPKREITVEPEAAGEPELYTSQQVDIVDVPEPGEPLIEAEPSDQPTGWLRGAQEPVFEGGLEPLEPLEPFSDDYAERVGDALAPSNIMPPLMPDAPELEAPAAHRLRGFTGASRAPLQFKCPYGLTGACCSCRYLPCNELTLAVLGHVSRDYEAGGRCSAD